MKSVRIPKFKFNEYGEKVRCNDYMKIFKQFFWYANHFELLYTLHQIKNMTIWAHDNFLQSTEKIRV